MKPYFWTILLLMCLGACSSDDKGSGAAAECAPIGEACDEGDCCPGTLCTVDGLLQTSCSQTCDTNDDCDTGCCHGLSNSSKQVCDLAIACQDGSSGGTAGSGGTSTMSMAGEPAGGGGSTGSPTCEDADAPGLLPIDALQLDATTDCNNTPLKHTGEVLSPGDVDWLSYDVTDEAGCVIEGSASVAGGDVELCAFGDLPNCEITCTTGTPTGREGYNGCCTSGDDPKLSWSTGCGIGESASGTMYLQVSATGSTCLPYELSYGF